MKLVQICLCISAICYSAFSIGQGPAISFYGKGVGLTHSVVNTIHTDDDGIMWVGTEEEVNWFTGNQIEAFRPLTSKSAPIFNVSKIYSDLSGGVWFFNTAGGIHRFNKRSWSFDRFQSLDDSITHSIMTGVSIHLFSETEVIVGTEQGVFKFDIDSRKISSIPINATIGGQTIIIDTFIEDSDGRLIAGSNRGIFVFNEKQNAFVRPFNSFIDGLQIIPTANQTPHLFIAVNAHLETFSLIKVDIENNNFEVIFESNYPISDYHLDSNKKIWISTYQGTLLVDENGAVIRRYLQSPMESSSPHNHALTIRSIKNQIWVLMTGSIGKYNPLIDDFKYYDIKNYSDSFELSYGEAKANLLVDSSDNIWFANNKGLVQVSEHKPNLTVFSFKNQTVTTGKTNLRYRAVLLDSTGKLWLGTQDSGLSMYDPETQVWSFYQNNGKGTVSRNQIRALIESEDGRIIVGTIGGGIDVYDRQTDTWQNFIDANADRSGRNHVFAFASAGNNKVWVGHGRGISVLNLNDNSLEPISNLSHDTEFVPMVRDIATLGDDLWLATHPPSYNPLGGTASFGGGLYRFNVKTGVWKRFSKNPKQTNSLSNDYVFSVESDSKGNIWAGTWGGGLNLYRSATQDFTHYTVENGLLSNVIYSVIVDDDDDVWASSPNGMTYFRPCLTPIQKSSQSCSSEVKTFTDTNEYHDIEFDSESFYYRKGGNIFFGGTNGIVSFAPSIKNWKNTAIPQNVILKRLQINGEDYFPEVSSTHQGWVNYTENISLNHEQHPISLELASNEMTSPTKNLYRYALNSGDWAYLPKGQSRLSFGALPPGKTELRMQTSNGSEQWSGTRVLTINVIPPWYKSLLFKVMAVMIFFIGLLIFLSLKKLRSERIQKQLNALVKVKTKELEGSHRKISELLESKQKMFETVTHELKTPLTLIVNSLQTFESQNQPNFQQASKVRENIVNLNIQIERLLSLAKNEAPVEPNSLIRLKNTVRLLVEDMRPLAENRHLSFDIECGPDVQVYFDEDMFRIVINNLLSNAVKYADNRTVIKINWTWDGNKFCLNVRNQCSSIKNEELQTIFEKYTRLSGHTNTPGSGLGLSVVRDILEKHNASIEALLDPLQLVCMKIKIPAKYVLAIDGGKQNSALVHMTDTNALDSLQIKPRILVVEDNLKIQQLICGILQDDFDVAIEQNGIGAMAYLNSVTPDLILLDIVMPNMGGIEFCKEIRGLPKPNCDVPIIVVSGKNDWRLKERAFEAGVLDFIEKPFNAMLLKNKVSNLLKLMPEVPKDISDYALKHDIRVGKNKIDQRFVERFKKCLKLHFSKPDLNVKRLARHLSMDERTLRRKCNQCFDEQPKVLLNNYRLTCAHQMLKTDKKISVVAIECGFKTANNFTKCFQNRYGITPREAKRQFCQ